MNENDDVALFATSILRVIAALCLTLTFGALLAWISLACFHQSLSWGGGVIFLYLMLVSIAGALVKITSLIRGSKLEPMVSFAAAFNTLTLALYVAYLLAHQA